MPLCYEQQFEVFHFECDMWDRMTPGSVLRRAQEIATDQCESLGIDEALYQRTGTVFLLSRLSLLVERMPRLDEQVRIQTRAYGMRKAVYHRVTTLYGQNGEKLCETDGRWVLVDRGTKHILRKPLDEFLPYFNEDPGEEHPMQMPKPMDPQPVAGGVAAYSLCDRNGHLNNTRYADILCDALPGGRLAQGTPRQMLLYYRTEIPFGTGYRLLEQQVGEDGFYYAAVGGGGKFFEGFVTF